MREVDLAPHAPWTVYQLTQFFWPAGYITHISRRSHVRLRYYDDRGKESALNTQVGSTDARVRGGIRVFDAPEKPGKYGFSGFYA